MIFVFAFWIFFLQELWVSLLNEEKIEWHAIQVSLCWHAQNIKALFLLCDFCPACHARDMPNHTPELKSWCATLEAMPLARL
ncbi:hypothetical protein AAHE18_09G112600 [Arachis hypogaea]